jgi:uncharacterized protein (DUF488 family)
VFTIGHSNRPLKDFLEILKAHGIQRVIDIRTIPRSRHNPQFNREELARSLRAAKIAYVHLKKLGGLRHARPDSKNRALKLAMTKTSALMCAEAVPWRCHRSLVADALLVRHVPVNHILSRSHAKPHALTPFARVKGKQITYPMDVPETH